MNVVLNIVKIQNHTKTHSTHTHINIQLDFNNGFVRRFCLFFSTHK